MRLVLAGGGRVVYFLAKRFLSKGESVAIINKSASDCETLARALEKAVVVHGNASNPKILEDAGTPMADIFLALTPNDADNLLMCQLANLRFGVPRTLALVNDPDNEDVFRKLGVDSAFSTTNIIGSLVEQKVTSDDIINLIPLEDGRVNVTEVYLDQYSLAIGKTVQQINMPMNSVLACIIRDESVVIPRGNTELKCGDKVILISLPVDLGQAIRALKGNIDTER